jgi:hypothetical protein
MRLKRLQPIILASLLSTPLFAGFDAMNPLQSTTHTANTPSQNTQITLSWNQAIANDGDNLGGYYYLLDQNENTLIPTVVDTRSTLGMSATSVTVTAPDEGTFYFHLAPYADSGNIGATLHFKFIKIDTTAPTALSISPDGGSFNSVQTISMSATDVNNYTIYYTTDNSDPSQSSTTYSTPFTLSSTKTIKAIAIDSAENISPISSSAFTINNTSNVAQFGSEVTVGSTIATNNNGGSSSFIPTISVEGTLVTEYKFKIDTASYSAQIAKAIPIDIASLQDGSHSISILGYDGTSLQLESEATTLNFTVDNTAPDNIIFSTPSGSEITSDTTITMSSSNSDSIYYTIDGSVPDETSINSSTVALSSTDNGTVTLRAISYDAVKNKSTVQEAIYTVNITAPTNNDSTSTGDTTPPPTTDNDTTPPTDDTTTDNDSITDDNNTSDESITNENNATSEDEETVPNEDSTPDEETIPNEDSTPDEGTVPNEDSTPDEGTVPNEDSTPDEGTIPNEDSTPDEGTVPNEDSTPDEGTVPNEDSTPDEGTPATEDSSSSVSLEFITDNGNKESVNIDSKVKDTTQTTNSDGTVIVTTSTETVKNELQVNTDGTLSSITTIGSTTSNIKVHTVGADTTFNADGSLIISSTISNSIGSSISSNIELNTDGEMVNTLNITVQDGTSTQSIIKSDIAGTDTVIADDGSMTMTTPILTTTNNQTVSFEIVLNVSGEVIPTLSIDGTEVSLPQFEAGSQLSIKTELNKILLIIETLLTQKLTFN